MTGSLMNNQKVEARKQGWLHSASFDLLLILAPAFVTGALALIFRAQFESLRVLPLWAWVAFVLLVDVAHVYATLFRTYFDRQAFESNRTLLYCMPLLAWTVGSLLYALDAIWFWRALAYLAVFHFIRQQYGFMALYGRNDSRFAKKFFRLDECFIYMTALYPILYWHCNLPRNFSWFVDGDFFEFLPLWLANLAFVLYLILGSFYTLKELIILKTESYINLPKNLIVAGTAFSWWVAIVAINSDMSFTMVNVVSHGIPYMALVWLYQKRSMNAGEIGMAEKMPEADLDSKPSIVELLIRICRTYLPAFLLLLFLLAYLEEGFWDGFIWREHLSFFKPFSFLPCIADKSVLALLIPFLALPQSTHYLLDGFIWRVKDRKSVWSA